MASNSSTEASTSAPTSKTLILRSSDDHYFEIPESAAVVSITIKNVVEDDCADKPIPITEVDAKTLSTVIEYLKKYSRENSFSDDEKRKFDKDLLASKTFEEVIDILLAANYLNIRGLLDIGAQRAADLMENRSVEWVREKLHVEGDYSAEEEEEFRKENMWVFEGVEKDD